MKQVKLYLFSIVLIAFFAACGSDTGHNHEGKDNNSAAGSQTENTQAKPHGEGKEYTSAYVCPMHCEGSGSDEAGNCPKCGMDYVKSEDHVKDGHMH